MIYLCCEELAGIHESCKDYIDLLRDVAELALLLIKDKDR